MKLNESVEEDIISAFQEVIISFKQLRQKCDNLADDCSNVKSLKYESDFLYDFCAEELHGKLKDMEEDILDEFYPINYADDEKDPALAGELYRNSVKKRENVFEW